VPSIQSHDVRPKISKMRWSAPRGRPRNPADGAAGRRRSHWRGKRQLDGVTVGVPRVVECCQKEAARVDSLVVEATRFWVVVRQRYCGESQSCTHSLGLDTKTVRCLGENGICSPRDPLSLPRQFPNTAMLTLSGLGPFRKTTRNHSSELAGKKTRLQRRGYQAARHR
jgi:hypothetical protein